MILGQSRASSPVPAPVAESNLAGGGLGCIGLTAACNRLLRTSSQSCLLAWQGGWAVFAVWATSFGRLMMTQVHTAAAASSELPYLLRYLQSSAHLYLYAVNLQT